MNDLKYFRNLDALRAFAAIGVIVAHYFSISRIPGEPIMAKIATFGNTGVSLFFVLSGFVITRILLQTHHTPDYFKSFYIRRTLRIFPLYYAALLVYYFGQYFLNITDIIPTFREQAFYYAYLQNFATTFGWNAAGPGHFWSLAVEEHFYLIWPALVYFALKGNTRVLIYLILALITGVHAVRFVMAADEYEINVFTFTRLDQLLMGALLAVLEFNGMLQKKNTVYFFALSAVGLFFIVLLESNADVLTKEVFKHTAFGFLYTGFIAWCCLLNDSHVVSRALQWAPLQFLGKVSYGIYVWHVLAIRGIDHFFQLPPYMGFAVVLATSFIMAWTSYQWLESPFLKLKSRFSYSRHDTRSFKVSESITNKK